MSDLMSHMPAEQKEFPNGFNSWQESHFEIVQDITENLETEDSLAARIYKEQGTGGLYLLAEKLTDEFEKLYKGEEWEEKIFFEEMSNFLASKEETDGVVEALLSLLGEGKEAITILAKEFSAVIRQWLTPEQLEIVKQRNIETTSASFNDCCATHDFIDSNMAMAEAFGRVAGREIWHNSDRDTYLFNQAWTMAKAAHFEL